MSDGPSFVLRGGEQWRDPWGAYRALRDEDPLHRVDHPDLGEFWVLSRFADVFAAARDPATFSSARGLTPGDDAMAMFEDMAAPLVMMDPPDHTALRRLVSRAMTPRAVAGLRPAIEAFVDAALDRVAEAGTVDIVEVLFKPLPSFVVADFLGVPAEDRGRFDGWTAAIVAANGAGDLEGASASAADLFTFALELIERRRTDPGDDLVSALVEAGEERASAMWIVGFVFTMVTGGNDTTTGLLGGAAELLTEHRDQRRVLIERPDALTSAVEELLRLTTPVQNLARTTTRPVELHGRQVPEGRKVLLLYGAANRDEREFGADAGELDVLRDPPRILSFGSGAHHCLGAAAARLQATVTLERILARFPDFEVDTDAAEFAPGAYVRRHASLPFTTAT